AGAVWAMAVGGSARRRVLTFALGAAATAGMLAYLQLSNWWLQPRITPVLLLLIGAASALAVTAVTAGLHNRRALYSALTVVALGVVLSFPMPDVLRALPLSNWTL